ncbi:sensor histidine kinase [Merismopedia glauca]|uniref:histidine kinase n=1 Tax=Merismopedia glauca CCAP 1448/3 TaxID=1296344 RepID=A0A2T1C0C7_9CYAN|nr:CHASE2 domain-containing protein [Merismopedia glauca]PSB01729.1 hypothetical protein C7B64_16740 [Merismopedia glauca CCAP 1448/3]
MALRKTWQRTALWLGIGWSILWSVILGDLPLIQQLDLSQHDRLIRLSYPRTPPSEIVLVTITEADLKSWGLANEPTIYSRLVDRLLDAGAAVVVLNLLPNWLQTSDHPHNSIKTLVQHHRDRLVLVLPTNRATESNLTEWRSYTYFLPSTSKGEPLFPSQSMLGFAEYEPEAKHPESYRSTARQASLSSQFTFTSHLERIQNLDSAALLTLKKFQPQKQSLQTPHTPIQIHFWGATGTFPNLEAQSVLTNSPSLLQVRHKIVLVGFSEIENPDTFAIRSPFGELMPAVELQANLVASLLTGSFERVVPFWLQYALIVLGGILLSKWVVWGKLNSTATKRYVYWLYPVSGLGGFALVGLILFEHGWILLITLPLVVWAVTVVSVWISLLLGVQKNLIDEQQCEIDRLHSVEQTAVISQARKLMLRLASDIHDGPLQELKVIMDRLEFLQMESPQLPIDPVLDQIEILGAHLRQHLNQTGAIALDITPELRNGLHNGIKAQLNQLIESKKLTLQVIQSLQSVEEPTFNSLWLEAREDIYRFFIEAIHNVIRHAQPPQGSATQVKVSLTQQGDRCTLIVENDGYAIAPVVFEPNPQQRQRGGYGTKLMDTIAAELPEGSVKRIVPQEGGFKVELTWKQLFVVNRSSDNFSES